MKFGFCFAILTIALVITITAIQGGVWYTALVYPAISFAIVSIGYLGVGPMIFGKSPQRKTHMDSMPRLLRCLIELDFSQTQTHQQVIESVSARWHFWQCRFFVGPF
jgi:hypothetical protein